MSFARGAYNALLYALLPHVFARLMWRSRREPAYREHIAERFGYYSGRAPDGPLIWIHAVSVGETRAAEPLVEGLHARYPDHRILMTHMTATGRETGEALYGDRVARCYLPYDYPAAVRRFLGHFRPQLGLLMETEIWPNLIRACVLRGVPLFLVNARMSERSYRRYARFAALARESTSALTAVAAQTEDDALRLRELGAARVNVTGNLKFDAAVRPEQVDLGRAWRRDYGSRRVLLAASTREGEEDLILDAYAAMPNRPLLVLVPRHPQRFSEVAAILERRGLNYERRSNWRGVLAETQVVLGDSMGEMPAYYAASDVAFVGGSLLPFGAHNFIEACAVGTPVLLGPHTYNFAEAAELAIGAGAALRVENAADLLRVGDRLLFDDETRTRMSHSALEFARAHQGATRRVLAMLPTLGP